jgi:hypothetical protein
MMRPSQLIVTTTGASTPIPLDRYVNGYAVAVTMKTAGAVYTLKQSFDSPYADQQGNPYTTSYNVSGVWLNFSDPIMVNASTNAVSNLAFIPAAIRLSAKTKTSAGNPVTLTIIPMGMDAN